MCVIICIFQKLFNYTHRDIRLKNKQENEYNLVKRNDIAMLDELQILQTLNNYIAL